MNCGNKCSCACGSRTVNMTKNGEKTEIKGCRKDATLLEIAQKNGVQMDNACGGNGACTTCMVKVHAGAENLSEITDREEMMGMSDETPEYRLGCQCTPEGGDVDVELMY
jgi:ferredoxin